jgi:hypothetical protein
MGGAGSGPAQNGGCAWTDAWTKQGGVYCAGNGGVGGSGGAGTPGYVKISWAQ